MSPGDLGTVETRHENDYSTPLAPLTFTQRSSIMNRICICTLLAVVMSVSKLSAQTLQGRDVATGIVEGIVTRTGTADPIANAKVSLGGGPFDPAALKQLLAVFMARGVTVSPPSNAQAEERFLQTLTDSAAARGVSTLNPDIRSALEQFKAANDARFAAVSDKSGHFTIQNVLPGRYTITVKRDGFFEDTSDQAFAIPVIISAGQRATSNLSMLSGATIAGRVTDSDGQPLANTTVQALSVIYQNGFPVLQASITKTTDDRGEYRLFWLPDGEYLIAAVKPSETTPGIISPSSGTNDTRTFYPGTANVSTAIPLVVQGGSQLSGVDIGVRPVETFRLSGEIRCIMPEIPAGQPNTLQTILTASLMLAARDPGVPEEGGPTALANVILRRSGNQFVGAFQISGILPGTYDLRVSTNDFSSDGGAQGLLAFAAIPIDINNQDLTGLSLDIYPNVRVKGIVTVDGRAPGQTPVRVALQVDGSASKRPSYQGLAKRPVLANDQDGSFVIPGVASGRFRVQPGPGLPADFYIADVLQGVSVFDTGFEVGKAPVETLHVLVKSGAGSLEGVVRNANGKPVSGATVVMVPPAARRQNHALYRTGISDASGHFKIDSAAPGDYDLFAWQNMPDGAYFNSRFVSRFQDRARAVNIRESSKANVDLTAIPSVGR
jgi:hypothetical protein